ncbi:glycosyl hydrolase [Murimonas intestini]|uniref:glycosyl hydrolase n=1 Tax=Murimonas intestini TaxID=1337051 RepID=UPI0011DC8C22|nr:glycosyl hydrolase [Murimonas intestini]
MDKSVQDVLENRGGNYIFPFLWMKGESQEIIAEEIDRIYDCGIRAVCIESRPHPDFLGEGWWKDMDFIVGLAKEKGMKLWLLDDAHFPTGYANHLIPEKYPDRKKTYINYNVQDVWGANTEMTLPIDCMMKPKTTWMDMGKPADLEERGRNKVVSITAYRLTEDSRIDMEDLVDLTPLYASGQVKAALPKGNWRIYVVYETRTDGGNPDYINIIDKDSAAVLLEAVYEPHFERYKEDFGTVFAGFFSDEPGMGNILGFAMDDIIGKKKMPLPWSGDVPVLLKRRLGDRWAQKLAALWTDTEEEADASQVRLAYMDVVTSLYAENFCGQIGRWCKEHHVEYVGHVIEDNGEHARLGCGAGHYFRAMSGQHMAGIDSIGAQIMPGGADVTHMAVTEVSGKFFHYVLGRLGASAGHLDPGKKGRTLCEACGAYGWKFGVRDMKWLLDHLMVQGVNHFVPHAFSMAEYPDPDCPPHFYARGNNPQYRHFAELMKYTNRMCGVLSGGRHGAKVAVLYQGEAEWMGEYQDMEEPAKVLSNHQIDFDFVPADILGDLDAYEGRMSGDGRTLMINGQSYKMLLVPYSRYITKTLDDFIRENREFDVCFINAYPEAVLSPYTEQGKKVFSEIGKVILLEDIADYAGKTAVSISLDRPFASMLVYDYEKNGKLYMLFNSDMYETFDGEIIVEGEKQFVLYDGMKNCCISLECRREGGKTYIPLTLPVYQSCILAEITQEEAEKYGEFASDGCRKQKSTGQESSEQAKGIVLELDRNWRVSACRSIDYPGFANAEEVDVLQPYSDKYPEFSGYICYEKEFETAGRMENAVLDIEFVYECAELWLDGVNQGKCICPPYTYKFDELSAGVHTLRIEVATTLDREQQKFPKPPFQYIFEAIEPTGMFGRVRLKA